MLYFKQLLAGRDFAQQDENALSMENFVYLIGDAQKKECVVVDPAWAIDELINIAQKDDMRIVGALATHYHPDHVGGNLFGHNIEGVAELMAKNPCPIHAHRLEAEGIQLVSGLSSSDLCLHDGGDKIRVGDIPIEIVHTPGHTPGSSCFRVKNALISGDTLFLTGCGRVDLPGGNKEQMYDTLHNRLATVKDEVVLYPGHAYGGENASMDQVRKNNPQLFSTSLNNFFKRKF